MARILLGWELGAGIGYTDWLARIARELKKQGHDCWFALRDYAETAFLVKDDAFPVMPGPYSRYPIASRSKVKGFNPTGFTDLLAANGYESEEMLWPLASGWGALVDLIKPDLCIGAYAPTLALAAYKRVPFFNVGHGYTTPPAHDVTWPRHRNDIEYYCQDRPVLEAIWAVQKRMGWPRAETLTEVYRGEGRFVISVSELDPYRRWRKQQSEIVGPLEKLNGIPALPARPRVYAYLAGDSDKVKGVVRAIYDAHLPGSFFIRDSTITVNDKSMAERGIRRLSAPPPLEEAVAGASVVVHHSGASTLASSLFAGRPQLLVPSVLDQVLTATEAEGLGVARTLRSNDISVGKITTWLRHLAMDKETQAKARRHAKEIRERGQHGSLEKIVEAARGYL